jgi:hypothetical protein
MLTTIEREGWNRRLKKFKKSWPREVANLIVNLGSLQCSIEAGVRLEQLKDHPFVQSEPMGMLAVNQRGPVKGAQLVPIRLYVYFDGDDSALHIIELGDKSTQDEDIATAKNYVKRLLREKEQRSSSEE